MSAVEPARPLRVADTRVATPASVMRPTKNSVSSTRPGEMTFTVMPRAPRSPARLAVHASIAAFAAPYEPAPLRAAIELKFITRAPSDRRASSALVTSTADSRFASKFSRHCAAIVTSPSDVVASGVGSSGSCCRSVLPPALFTNTSTRSGRSGSAAATAYGSLASNGTARAPMRAAASASRSARRPVMVTAAPPSANVRAISNPMPVPPPVTTTLRVVGCMTLLGYGESTCSRRTRLAARSAGRPQPSALGQREHLPARVPVPDRHRDAELAFEVRRGQLGVAQAVRTPDVCLTADDPKLVRRELRRIHGGDLRRRWRPVHETDDVLARVVGAPLVRITRKRIAQLVNGTDDARGRQAGIRREPRLDRGGDAGRGRLRGQHRVSALQHRRDVGVAEVGQHRAEIRHRDPRMAADVDPTEKEDVARGLGGHGAYPVTPRRHAGRRPALTGAALVRRTHKRSLWSCAGLPAGARPAALGPSYVWQSGH